MESLPESSAAESRAFSRWSARMRVRSPSSWVRAAFTWVTSSARWLSSAPSLREVCTPAVTASTANSTITSAPAAPIRRRSPPVRCAET